MTETLVVLVSGRGALTTLSGVPSVQRHVQAGLALGLDVVVVYPPERRALGAEIRGLLADTASCIPADQFAAQPSGSAESPAPSATLVIAAEWFLAMGAVVAVRDAAAPRLFGRVRERGCLSVPIARVTREEAVQVARHLGTTSAAATLAGLCSAGAGAVAIDLDPRHVQRLSDNVSTAHAEEKLIENLFGQARVLPVLRLRPTLAPLLARLFSATALGPAGISALKLAIGLLAAWVLGSGTYAGGVAGALIYFAARLIGASGTVLARASLADSDIRERLDLAGDTVLHVALLWSLAGGAAQEPGAIALAVVATTGVLISTTVAYVFVWKGIWEARRRAAVLPGTTDHAASDDAASEPAAKPFTPHTFTAGDDFLLRFVQRDGIAYALLFAALAGRLDLLLWAATVASHLFYVLWLLARARNADSTMPVGRPA